MVTMGSRNLLISDSAEDIKKRLQQLNSLRKNRHFCDVVLQVGTAEVHAHRSVLACASPYFFELFTRDDDRRSAKEDKVVYKLSGNFQHESLEKLVGFAYTGEIELTGDIVRHVYLCANKLKMERVSKACGEFLVASLTPDNCLSIRNIPGITSNPDLVEQIDKFIFEQDDLMRISNDVSGVTRLQLRVMQTSLDEASITSYALCMLSIEWIKRQMEGENQSFEDLQEKKHLLYLNLDNSLHDCSEIRTDDLKNTDMVQDYKKISRKLSKSTMKVSKKISMTLQPSKPRMMLYSRSISDEDELQDVEWKLVAHSQTSDKSYVAIVTLNGTVCVLSIVKVINPPSPTNIPIHHISRPVSVEKVDNYTLIAHMSTPKCAIGAGAFHGCLLVVGGYDRGECLKEVELYSPVNNAWTSFPGLRDGRGRFDLTVLDGLAYSVGGCDGIKELSSVEVLNYDTQRWTRVADLPLARSNSGVCSTQGNVYCIGGWNGYSGIKQCDMYDPKSDTWSTIPPMHTGRYQCGVAALGDEIFVAGGCDAWNCLNSVEIFNVVTNTWRTGPSLTTPRRGCGLAVFNGKLFLMGGSDGQQSLCSTEVYDPETNSWAPGASMTTCRANVGVAVVDGKLYAVGGFSGKTFLNTIEYLDSKTMEWTNFTPKPVGYKSKRSIRSRNTSAEEIIGGVMELDDCIPETIETPSHVNNGFISVFT